MAAQSVVRDTVLVYFEQGLSGIAPSLRGNQKSLDSIAAITGRYSRNPQFHLYVKGWASPEGTSAFNTVLSHDRAAAVIACIESLSGRTLPPSAYTLAGMGIDWEGLSRILSRGASFPGRDEVLRIIRNTPVWQITDGKVTGSRKKSLMDLHRGETFRYMTDSCFHTLRRAEIIMEYVPYPPVEATAHPVFDIKALDSILLSPRPLPEHIPDYRFALKTNLLADIALMPSLEAEYLIRPEWSVAVHGAVAWWSIRPRHRYYQIATIYPEARWWFHTRAPWHGHYLGLFAGGNWYDLENGGRGYKGESGFAGLSYGYMMPVGERLSLEFGIGAGWLFTEYEEYLPVPYMGGTHYVYQQTSRMHYFGPLKLKFALAWRFGDWDFKKGGAR